MGQVPGEDRLAPSCRARRAAAARVRPEQVIPLEIDMPPPRPRLALPLTVLLATLLTAAPSPAQPATPEPSDQVVSRPSIGLTATLPVGATRSSYEIAGRETDGITLPGMAAIINISDRQLSKAQTLRGVADSIIRDQLASVSAIDVDPSTPTGNAPGLTTAKGRLLSREVREINGWSAEIFYLQLARVGGDDAAVGYAVFMPTGNTVALFELQTTEGELAAAKPYFELMVNSTRIVDPAVASAQRATGVEAGISFFQSLTPADYENVIKRLGEDWRYERFYEPAPSGSDQDATELGYRRTRYALGRRADLKTESERGNSRPEDRQRGFLIFQEVRILHGDQVVDLAAGFFMTPDRQQEAWSIRQTVKPLSPTPGRPTTNVVESGVRDRGDLMIARSQGGKPVESINPAIEGTGYISRVEVLLLPYLLMHKDAPGSYRCYAFNQLADRITLREDTLERGPDGEWTHTSAPSETSPAQTAIYDAKGDLVRAERADSQVWEPISLRRLYELWSGKKLPMN